MSNYTPKRGGNPSNTGQFSTDSSRRAEVPQGFESTPEHDAAVIEAYANKPEAIISGHTTRQVAKVLRDEDSMVDSVDYDLEDDTVTICIDGGSGEYVKIEVPTDEFMSLKDTKPKGKYALTKF